MASDLVSAGKAHQILDQRFTVVRVDLGGDGLGAVEAAHAQYGLPIDGIAALPKLYGEGIAVGDVDQGTDLFVAVQRDVDDPQGLTSSADDARIRRRPQGCAGKWERKNDRAVCAASEAARRTSVCGRWSVVLASALTLVMDLRSGCDRERWEIRL